MKLSVLKKYLSSIQTLKFQLPNNQFIPEHFHITEVGEITKKFIDCGGQVRVESVINFQLWVDHDVDHRLAPEKLQHIIDLSEKAFNLKDLDLEVEYQGNETIGKYGLEFNGLHFVLVPKKTACLAEDGCGIPQVKPRIRISEIGKLTACKPNSGCC